MCVCVYTHNLYYKHFIRYSYFLYKVHLGLPTYFSLCLFFIPSYMLDFPSGITIFLSKSYPLEFSLIVSLIVFMFVLISSVFLKNILVWYRILGQ